MSAEQIREAARAGAERAFPDDYAAEGLWGGVIDTHRDAYVAGYLAAAERLTVEAVVDVLREHGQFDIRAHRCGCGKAMAFEPGTIWRHHAEQIVALLHPTENGDERG